MDGLSAFTIDTRIVYGLKGAGKTSYISDCIANDFFYKDGTTLILCFEQGKEKYDEEALLKKRTYVAICGDPRRTGEFCTEQIRKYQPDRIYVEMNAKFLPEEEQFPASMNITSAVTWIEWTTLDQYMNVYRQWFGRMIAKSQQVIFRGCPSRELLAPYSAFGRIMSSIFQPLYMLGNNVLVSLFHWRRQKSLFRKRTILFSGWMLPIILNITKGKCSVLMIRSSCGRAQKMVHGQQAGLL